MITGFNPTVSNNRNQRTNFKALPIDKIIENHRTAETFVLDVYKGKFPKTDENVQDLETAYNRTKDCGIKSHLEDAFEKWGVKLPSKQ